MPLKLTTEIPFSDKQLIDAIRIRISECFGAMSVANALAGGENTQWKLLRAFTPLELFDEAKERGIPLETLTGSVGERPIAEAPVWKSYLDMKSKGES